ncbi:cytoplasmic dynein-like protein 1 intermediate chain 2 [Diplocarpon rosae]|nr:cytoplasmic dynein-like protein 1 intermediate chain 2 [Diplocarpon rosae]
MMQQRRDEILAKKAKLAELKRQRELRTREISTSRQSIGSPSDLISPTPSRAENREELDKYISSILVDKSRSGSTGPGGAGSPAGKGSRPNSVLSAGELSNEASEPPISQIQNLPHTSSIATQTLSTVALSTIFEFPPSPIKEVFSYSKGVQTSEEWGTQTSRPKAFEGSEKDEGEIPVTSTPNKKLSRKERDREEELRENIRKEILEELKATQELVLDGPLKSSHNGAANFPARALTHEELNAVTSSEDFMDFVEKSSKVIERALDQEYDILADYALGGENGVEDDDDEYGNTRGKGRRRVKEAAQFYDERWSKKRMVSDISFSPKFPELLLASYTKNPSAPHEPDGLVQVWNMHLHDRPEFVFHAQSDVLAAKFSPFHPNLIIGGCYSGQVLLWDTRAKSSPVQKTPLTGSGHTHPVYSVDIVGTQNANNIISCSTDGVVCGWTVDMLAQPQERLALTTPAPAKTEDLSPTCMAFPQTDPTYFLVGSEEGTIFPCHRYDRAGAKAGVDQRVSYRGHAAPVMSIAFHPARGPVDLGDLVLSSSLDWSVKLWKVRAPAATSTTGVTGESQSVFPILDFTREDVVYDAAWSPVKPGVFSLVDGAGTLEVWDITVDTEVPLSKVTPSTRKGGRSMISKSLNKLAWDELDGKRLATGGIDGTLTVFEVGPDLGGKESARNEEWSQVKKLVAKLEGAGVAPGRESNGVNGGLGSSSAYS